MCERPVSVAFVVARNRVRMAVFAGLKSEFWLAFWSFREETHNYRIAMTSRRWRLELRVYVTKLQKSKDGEFRFVHRCTCRCLVRFHFARNELILVALYREALCVCLAQVSSVHCLLLWLRVASLANIQTRLDSLSQVAATSGWLKLAVGSHFGMHRSS